jgi:hypothetical protein
MEFEALEIKEFPIPARRAIYTTDLMREMASRTQAVHGHGAFVVYSGEAGVGKTTTARELTAAFGRAFTSENPRAFRAIHFEVGRVANGHTHEAKRMIRSLYAAVGANLDEGVYERHPPEEIAGEFIEYIRQRRIQMIFVDEAGLLSLEGINGLVTVLDIAKNNGWPLTIVLIGMDDLPLKLRRRPQIARRVFEWCTFVRYGFEDTVRLLRAMHPHFEALSVENPQHRAQFEFVQEISGGLPGFMASFIERFDYRLRGYKDAVTVNFLKTVHLLTVDSMKMAMDLARKGYAAPEAAKDKKKKRDKRAQREVA